MEFWEGAVLVVGGVFLVGHLSRRSPTHPLNTLPYKMAATRVSDLPMLSTNTAGDRSIVFGESLAPPDPPLTAAFRRVVMPVDAVPLSVQTTAPPARAGVSTAYQQAAPVRMYAL